MKLAILMTNTDDSPFSERHPLDDAKFTDLIHIARPDWVCDAFFVKDGVFPEDLSPYDGAMITGSIASVNSGAPWVKRLLDLLREAVESEFPLFGACFGHQAIAVALGGRVEKNPDGWVHGSVRNEIVNTAPWMEGLPQVYQLYGSHSEQVTALPQAAQLLSRSEQCPHAGFAIGDHVYTTQHHPEMEPGFIAALTDEMEDLLGEDGYERAVRSLQKPANQEVFAHSIAQFFERATSREG